MLLDEDYALLHEVFEQTTPSAITLEYARDSQAVIAQLERLRHFLDHS